MVYVLDSAHFHRAVNAAAYTAATNPLETSPKPQILSHAHLVVERIVLGHVTNSATNLERLFKHIQTSHFDATGRGRDEAGQDAHGCALTGTVGTKKPDDLTAIDAK